ncbi:hypothetical protein OUZ56_029976 [Daphnia magna]|uniref:THAP-type domain-containing protein n=1 Tax=Daphnia magna TaxID=35525 RepID=A0ABR0B8F0_9CRUS|nr:hypothetical protein OUZ56_029976 [Daphnia magna]
MNSEFILGLLRLLNTIRALYIGRRPTIYDKENQKVSTFGVNKTNLESWQQKAAGITVGDKLCEKHFAPNDVIKGSFVLDYLCPYKRWRVAENAIPQYFLRDAKVIPNPSPRLTTRPKQKTSKKPAEET